MLICFDDSNFNLSQFLLFFRQLLKTTYSKKTTRSYTKQHAIEIYKELIADKTKLQQLRDIEGLRLKSEKEAQYLLETVNGLLKQETPSIKEQEELPSKDFKEFIKRSLARIGQFYAQQ